MHRILRTENIASAVLKSRSYRVFCTSRRICQTEPNWRLPSMETFAKTTLATAATLSTIGMGLIWYGQNYLIYPSAFPPGSRIGDVATPRDFDMPFVPLDLKTEDDVILKCYLLLQKKDLGIDGHRIPIPNDMTEEGFISTRPTIVMFHGNGGNVGHRIPLAAIFYKRMRCNVLMMSYRGYGLSEGSPCERGIKIDAQTALDYLTSHPDLNKTRIVLYGQSIGGAVAIDLASRNPTKIEALILENTFTSLPELVPHALPILGPFSFLCHQKWDSASKIPLIPATTPILMLSGLQDEIIPKAHMLALWEAVARRGEQKKGNGSEFKVGLERAKYIEFADGRHNDTCAQHGYWAAIAEFMSTIVQGMGEKVTTRTPTNRF